MSKIAALFHSAELDPETGEILAQAFEKARRSLHDKGQPGIVQEVIVQRIIAAAQMGERNPDKLCESALIALGNKAVFER